jgi:hypothetical protein
VYVGKARLPVCRFTGVFANTCVPKVDAENLVKCKNRFDGL